MASLSVVKSTVMLLRRLALFRFVSLFVAFAMDPSSLQHCKALALKFSLFSFTFSFLLQLTITNKQPQEVWATLKSRHPDIEFDAAAVAEHKEKRDKVCIPPFSMLCRLTKSCKALPPLCIPVAGQNWNFAEASAIDDGIKYLKGLKATLSIAGHTCNRISCSWNSAIHWCNDVGSLFLFPPILSLVQLNCC
jgi:hypothetical protein